MCTMETENRNRPETHLPKIGFGTAHLGGIIFPFHWRDAFYISVMRSALKLGYPPQNPAASQAPETAPQQFRRDGQGVCPCEGAVGEGSGVVAVGV